jgi:hypothetical protein
MIEPPRMGSLWWWRRARLSATARSLLMALRFGAEDDTPVLGLKPKLAALRHDAQDLRRIVDLTQFDCRCRPNEPL